MSPRVVGVDALYLCFDVILLHDVNWLTLIFQLEKYVCLEAFLKAYHSKRKSMRFLIGFVMEVIVFCTFGSVSVLMIDSNNNMA